MPDIPIIGGWFDGAVGTQVGKHWLDLTHPNQPGTFRIGTLELGLNGYRYDHNRQAWVWRGEEGGE